MDKEKAIIFDGLNQFAPLIDGRCSFKGFIKLKIAWKSKS